MSSRCTIALQRWAEVLAGRASSRQQRRLAAHAKRCARCQAMQSQLAATQRAFAELRAVEPPELSWDHIGARIRWHTESERRAAQRSPSRSLRRWIWAPALAVLALAATFHLLRSSDQARTAAVVREAPPAVLEPAPESLRGVVAFVQGEAQVRGGVLAMERSLSAGDLLSTGADGRVAVQFGAGSGFLLAPSSRLELVRFDSRAVELRLEGSVSIEVAKRAPEQRFAVLVGDKTVLVRGTAFRVRHQQGRVEVACAHGRVVVTDAAGIEVGIDGGEALSLWIGDVLAGMRPAPAVSGSVEPVPLLAVWPGADEVLAASSSLFIDAGPAAAVAVDGVAVASGRFSIRVAAGRHHVTWGAADQWVEVGPGQTRRASFAAPAPPIQRTAGRNRGQQLANAVARSSQIPGCLRSLRKQGLGVDAYITFDIGISTAGRITHLNIVDTNLPRSVAACVRDVVDAERFGAGGRAVLEQRFDL